MGQELEIRGFDELLQALRDAPEQARPLVEAALQDSLALLHERLASYPPASAANRPGRTRIVKRSGQVREVPQGYYERGRGWWYPVMRARTLGERLGVRHGALSANQARRRYQGGKPLGEVAGYKLRPGSERLGTKWTTRVSVTEFGAVGEIGTNVSYADYVQGRKQPTLFGMRGWQTLDQALEASRDEIEAAFAQAAAQWAEEFNTGGV
jgi:hypothetical protein